MTNATNKWNLDMKERKTSKATGRRSWLGSVVQFEEEELGPIKMVDDLYGLSTIATERGVGIVLAWDVKVSNKSTWARECLLDPDCRIIFAPSSARKIVKTLTSLLAEIDKRK